MHEEDTKHIGTTIDIFYKCADIGFIGGQIKEKYGTIRWYADLRPIGSLHDIFKAGHVAYRWCALEHPVKDFFNNMSKYFFKLKPIIYMTFYYKVLIYNVAYRLALYRSPGYEKEILNSCEHDEMVWGYERLKAKYGDGWF
jgi:hypothetical protein